MASRQPCAGCEVVDMPSRAAGVLYLAPPVPHTRTKITQAAEQHGLSVQEEMAGILAVSVAEGNLDPLLHSMMDYLSEPERQECNALFLREGEALTMGGVMQARPLERLTSRADSRWLVDLMESDRLFMHFHPIVEMRAPNRVYAHECLLRGQDESGNIISPFKLFDAARRADLLFHLDRAARLTAIRDSLRHDIPEKIFINFNPTAIYDPAFCLQTTVRATQDAGIDPGRLVFEVIESEEMGDTDHLLSIIDFYRKAGFSVALDDLGSGYASLNLLTALKPDYVKFDRELIREIDGNPYKQKIFSKLAELAQDLGVKTVAEGIETEAEWHFLREHKVDFAQGFLMCKPAAPPLPPNIPESH
jgi:EAL domain-containing protein (putative c-di-GMP-specific phosphodiesterase class I)